MRLTTSLPSQLYHSPFGPFGQDDSKKPWMMHDQRSASGWASSGHSRTLSLPPGTSPRGDATRGRTGRPGQTKPPVATSFLLGEPSS
jgi:hypothetical protein